MCKRIFENLELNNIDERIAETRGRVAEIRERCPNGCRAFVRINGNLQRLESERRTAVILNDRDIEVAKMRNGTHDKFIFESAFEMAYTDGCAPFGNDARQRENLRIMISDGYKDGYDSVDIAAMAAANRLRTAVRNFNREYSMSIYQCMNCGGYYLSRLRKGIKDRVEHDTTPIFYRDPQDERPYPFALKAIIHSHPILRRFDPCNNSVCSGNDKNGGCTVKPDIMLYREFSIADYEQIFSANVDHGYLVTNEIDFGDPRDIDSKWKLMRFEIPEGERGPLKNTFDDDDIGSIRLFIAESLLHRIPITGNLINSQTWRWEEVTSSAHLSD